MFGSEAPMKREHFDLSLMYKLSKQQNKLVFFAPISNFDFNTMALSECVAKCRFVSSQQNSRSTPMKSYGPLNGSNKKFPVLNSKSNVASTLDGTWSIYKSNNFLAISRSFPLFVHYSIYGFTP